MGQRSDERETQCLSVRACTDKKPIHVAVRTYTESSVNIESITCIHGRHIL
jgi:hypothetical protein